MADRTVEIEMTLRLPTLVRVTVCRTDDGDEEIEGVRAVPLNPSIRDVREAIDAEDAFDEMAEKVSAALAGWTVLP